MAKVKITGHASGTGVLTVTAPNTSTDRTITLPDSTGTLATTADTFDPDGAVTINDSGADVDFRVESDDNANMIFVDGGNDAVGIGTATPNTVGSATGLTGNNFKVGSTSAASRIILEGATTADLHMADVGGTANEKQFRLRADGATWTFSAWNDAFGSSTELLKLHHGGAAESQFTASAWFNLNGTGTISVLDSYNISSIADNGTGHYECNWDINMGNENYSVVGNSGQYAGSINPITRYVASYVFKSFNDNAAATDDANIMLIAFGD